MDHSYPRSLKYAATEMLLHVLYKNGRPHCRCAVVAATHNALELPLCCSFIIYYDELVLFGSRLCVNLAAEYRKIKNCHTDLLEEGHNILTAYRNCEVATSLRISWRRVEEWSYSATHQLQHEMDLSGQLHVPSALSPRKSHRYTMNWKLHEAEDWSGNRTRISQISFLWLSRDRAWGFRALNRNHKGEKLCPKFIKLIGECR